jgi:hypothetical protein
MATLGSSYFDLIDLYKRQDENRQIATVIELLKENNAILDDAIAQECNLGVKHRTTIRTGLPSVTWGKFYQGISQSKSTTAQVDDTTGFVEGLSSVDTRLLDISGNRNAVRLSEAQSFLESIAQDVASTLIYGNDGTDPTKFLGLAPRFNSLGAVNGGQIVDGGGTGADNTSVWFVTWGDNQCHTLYPAGTAGGVQREDMGRQRTVDGSGNPYFVEEELFTQHMGLTVRDWRYVSRIANIDTSDLQAGSVDIYALMRKAFWKIKKHRLPGTRMAIYCNADVLEALDADSTPTMGTITGGTTRESYVRLRPTEVDGFEVMSYRGIPVRQVDAILNNEAQIT